MDSDRDVRITSENGGTIKFTGMVDKTGIPTKGTLYFSDGPSAKVDSETGELVYSNGNVYKGRPH